MTSLLNSRSFVARAFFALVISVFFILGVAVTGRAQTTPPTQYDGVQDNRIQRLEDVRRRPRRPSPLPGKVKALEGRVDAAEKKNQDQDTDIATLDSNVKVVDAKVDGVKNRDDNNRTWLWILTPTVAIIGFLGFIAALFLFWNWIRTSRANRTAQGARQFAGQAMGRATQAYNRANRVDRNSRNRDRLLRHDMQLADHDLGIRIDTVDGRVQVAENTLGQFVAATNNRFAPIETRLAGFGTRFDAMFEPRGFAPLSAHVGTSVTIPVDNPTAIGSVYVGATATGFTALADAVQVVIPNGTVTGTQIVTLVATAGPTRTVSVNVI